MYTRLGQLLHHRRQRERRSSPDPCLRQLPRRLVRSRVARVYAVTFVSLRLCAGGEDRLTDTPIIIFLLIQPRQCQAAGGGAIRIEIGKVDDRATSAITCGAVCRNRRYGARLMRLVTRAEEHGRLEIIGDRADHGRGRHSRCDRHARGLAARG